MILSIKNFVKDVKIKYFISLKCVDVDFWDSIYRNDLEEV